MKAVNSFDEVRSYIDKVRGHRKGFLTNFYPDQRKVEIWISHERLFIVEGVETAIFLKKSDRFTNILYCATTKEQLIEALVLLPKDAYVFEQIVDVRTDASLLDELKTIGYQVRKSLVRMSKINDVPETIKPNEEFNATTVDIPVLDASLQVHFDEYAEQLPTLEELHDFIEKRHVIVKRIDGNIAGFIIYDQTPSTLYLRYWLVNPEYRNQGVGSILFHEYNRRGAACKRHMLWVIEDNNNAIKRYKHYGYRCEMMKDYVLTQNITN